MKEKYLLRGMGIGIVLSVAVFILFSGKEKEKLTDSEIRERAKQLGMMTMEEVLEKNLDRIKHSVLEKEKEKKETEGQKDQSDTKTKDASEGEETYEDKKGRAAEGTEQKDGSEETKGLKERMPKKEDKESETQRSEVSETEKNEDEIGAGGRANQEEDGTGGSETAEQPRKSEKARDRMIIVSIAEGADSLSAAETLQAAGVISDADKFNGFLIKYGYAKGIKPGGYSFNGREVYYQIANKITGH